uniref:CD40 n=1 Tax=Tetraodon nigroviridis TaxID=99883 RepID=B8YI10_TETNG|nr:CD40 [Tetraodon nigroviridis]
MRLHQLVVGFLSSGRAGGRAPRCDPITQYNQDGGCCDMCPPGTSMTSLGNCLEPQCKKCEDGEYQDKYTKEPKCHLQPYCDPNKNFQIPKYNLKERSVCSCREGFHCSSSHCTSCVPHTACNPGYGVKLRGNHSKDTECERCSEGTFSQNGSQTEACQRWTECPWGWEVVQAGTDISDQICGAPRIRAVVISVVVIFIVSLVVVGLIFRRPCWPEGKRCIELCMEEKEDPPKENKPLVMHPTATIADEPTLPERLISREEPRTPEEVDDDLSQEISITTEIHLTDNGKFVMQDKGMKEVKLEA